MTKQDYKEYDYIIGMDAWNLRNMNRITGGDPDGKIHLLLDYSKHPRDIADPWYTGNFDDTYRDVVEGCEAFFRIPKTRRIIKGKTLELIFLRTSVFSLKRLKDKNLC